METDPAAIVTAADVVAFDVADDEHDAVVLDVLVLLRYQAPDWDRPRLAYISTRTMDRAALIGVTSQVLDHLRADALTDWETRDD